MLQMRDLALKVQCSILQEDCYIIFKIRQSTALIFNPTTFFIQKLSHIFFLWGGDANEGVSL